MKNNNKTSSIIKAITAIVAPKLSAPVSPMKNFAGGILFHKNPAVAPAILAHNVANISCPFKNAMIPSDKNDMIDNPAASPSSPSVKLTAFENPATARMNSGM